MTARILALAILAPLAAQDPAPEPIRVGLVGLDTSHCIAFTKILNDPKGAEHVPGARVVCGWKGGSPDVKSSIDRVEGYTKDLREKYGVDIVDTIEALCAKVDAVILTSVDGRVHLEQAKPIFAAKKRVFIDKPLAAGLKDGREIARLARGSGTPFFSASSLRWHDPLLKLKESPEVGKLLGCETWSPCPTEPHHPDLFWYGVHGVEMLYALMGAGCESVRNWHTTDVDIVTGRWKDGRMATFRGIRKGKSDYGATLFGEKAIRSTAPGGHSYRPLLVEIVKFFRSGAPPVAVDEQVEVLAFMQAAEVSKERGGAEVRLDELR
jgi:predicted dehydrogenase